MRIRRGLLFWGLFLIPLGVLPLLVRTGALDPAAVADAWRFWPLLLVGLGIAVLLGRSRAGAVGIAAVALVLGSLVGGTLASGGLWIGSVGDCTGPGSDTQVVDRSGTFSAPGAVTIDIDCGTANLTTASAEGWTVHADYRGAPPVIDDGGASLVVRTPTGGTRHHQDWQVAVAPAQLRSVELTANAGASRLELAGADLDRVRADVNAADLLIDGGSAAIAGLDVSLNAGRARITLGAGSTTGELSANAGAVELCVPAGTGLRLRVDEQLTFAHNLDDRGLTRDGASWVRAGSGEIDLSIDGNAASFTLDPEGGCK